MTLTHQDQRELNKKARAHGLPDLWPEAEELEKRFHHQMKESYERALCRAGGTYSPLGTAVSPPPWSAYFPPPWSAYKATQRFQAEGGLTTPRKSFLEWLFG